MEAYAGEMVQKAIEVTVVTPPDEYAWVPWVISGVVIPILGWWLNRRFQRR